MKKTDTDRPSPDDLLRRGLGEIGLQFRQDEIHAFLAYLGELRKWSKAYNLTGLKTDSDIIIKNFLDSLLFCKALPEGITSLADIGSGAGFPGIPIKIIKPHIKTILIEPTGKKALFLRHISQILGLRDVMVIDRRIEDVSGIIVDAVVTRALFSVSELIAKAGHILRPGGVFILSKGPKLEEELKGLEGRDVRIQDEALPFDDAVRRLVIVRK